MNNQQPLNRDGDPDDLKAQQRNAQSFDRITRMLQQKQGELDQIKTKLIHLYDFSPVGLLTLDTKGVIQDINLRALDLFDAVRDELVGLPFSDLVQESSRKKFQEHLQAVLYDEKMRTCQLELHRPHTHVFFAHLSTQISSESRGEKLLQTVIVDTTEEKVKSDQKLMTGNHYQSWLRQLPQPVVIIDREGLIRFVSHKTLFLLGYSHEDEVLGKKVLSFVKLDDRHLAVKEISSLTQSETIVDFIIHLVHKDGSFLWADLVAGKLKNRNDTPGEECYAIIIRNMSEREIKHQESHKNLQSMIEQKNNELRRANQTLQREACERKLYQEKLSSLVMQMADLEEQERRRIATDLHDHVCQQLSLNNLELKKARDSASLDLFDKIIAKNESLIQNVRNWMFELSPPVLYELGFVAALRWYAEKMHKEYPIHIVIEEDKIEKPLDDITRNILFQSVRELFNNVLKHAQASQVKIRIFIQNSLLALEFRDNGIGFDTKTVFSQMRKTDHFGLFNIRERLYHIGGHFSVTSSPDNGTVIFLKAPLKGQHRKGEK